MGGRGAAFHVNAMELGRHMDLSGFYAPTDIAEAERWHFDRGTFDRNKWDNLTSEQRTAIEQYTANYYRPMNDALFGKSTPSERVKQLISDATEGMKAMRATSDFVVWRGDALSDTASLLGGTLQQMYDPKFLSRSIGKTVEFKGFMSSAITESYAWTHKGVTVTIKVPAGTAGFYVDPVSINSGEKEFLFAPGTKMKVQHITRGAGGKLVKIELEVINKK